MRKTNITTKKSASHCAETTAQAPARPFPSLAEMGQRAATAAGLKRGGFVDDARRAATPYVVDCHGLNRENLGDEPYRFQRELRERAGWCDENGGLCEIEPLRDDETNALGGYRFRFEKLVDATHFKLRFDTNL